MSQSDIFVCSSFYGKEARELVENIILQNQEDIKLDVPSKRFSLNYYDEAYGVEVSREMEYWGYRYMSDMGWLVSTGSEGQFCRFTFSMTKK